MGVLCLMVEQRLRSGIKMNEQNIPFDEECPVCGNQMAKYNNYCCNDCYKKSKTGKN